MAEDGARSLEVRLTEYRDSLRLTVDGIRDTIGKVRSAHPGKDVTGLADTAVLLGHVADDVSKILDGVELRGWRIDAEIGPAR